VCVEGLTVSVLLQPQS